MGTASRQELVGAAAGPGAVGRGDRRDRSVWCAAAGGGVSHDGTVRGAGHGVRPGGPAVAAALAASGHRRGLPLLAAAALACWAVFLGGFPWFQAVAYPGASSVLRVGPQALRFPADQLSAIFGQRWWDDVAMAAAGTILLAPWLWVARLQPGTAPSRSGGDIWGRWLVPTLVLAGFVLMALGTQACGRLDCTRRPVAPMGCLAAWFLGSTAPLRSPGPASRSR